MNIYFWNKYWKKVEQVANEIQNKEKSKKNRKTDEEVIQIIRNLRLIDDVLFEKFMEDAAVCVNTLI